MAFAKLRRGALSVSPTLQEGANVTVAPLVSALTLFHSLLSGLFVLYCCWLNVNVSIGSPCVYRHMAG